jgi:TetR/AcrR family transcriptional repressor of nem operon
MAIRESGLTASAILDTAERLAQTRGYNGFSYADIAAELDITKAALHYHFAGKAQLGESIIARYHDWFAAALAAIDAEGGSEPDRLAAYCDIYRQVLKQGRMCLCGMLAAEYTTLPGEMQQAIAGFFALNQRWLASLLRSGLRAGTLRFREPPARAAETIVAALEGALLVARPSRRAGVLESVVNRLLADFSASR